MSDDKDILQSRGIKDIPYCVPEGYFEDFATRMAEIANDSSDKQKYRTFMPYLAYAALLLVMVCTGTFLLKTFTPKNEDFDILTYTQPYPQTCTGELFYSQNTEENLSEEDIINYLIYCVTDSEMDIDAQNEL